MANDPESTVRLYDEVMERLGFPQGGNPDIGPERCVGLLSLRADRGDRTLQWADALAGGLLDRFDAPGDGLHATALERRVRRLRARRGVTRPMAAYRLASRWLILFGRRRFAPRSDHAPPGCGEDPGAEPLDLLSPVEQEASPDRVPTLLAERP